MLTQKDIKAIEDTIDIKVDPKLKSLDEKISSLPTKAHFDKRMDELMGEVQDMRDEQTLHQGQHDEITDRLERIDKHLGTSTL